jgi:hypothetical protein
MAITLSEWLIVPKNRAKIKFCPRSFRFWPVKEVFRPRKRRGAKAIPGVAAKGDPLGGWPSRSLGRPAKAIPWEAGRGDPLGGWPRRLLGDGVFLDNEIYVAIRLGIS